MTNPQNLSLVKYVDYQTASNAGMIQVNASTVRIGVDRTPKVSGSRNSVRITSKNNYNSGLIILDLAHMPGSVCGSWPAFWTVGPNWPTDGEIDIIEGVNSNLQNQISLHTNNLFGYCGIDGNNFTGKLTDSNCYIYAPNQPKNTGCSTQATANNTYGDDFNAIGGGVYSTLW